MRIYIPFLIPFFVGLIGFLLAVNVGVYFISVPEKFRNHLPALSETSIYPPGRYIFSTTLTLACFLMILLAIAAFFAMKSKIFGNENLFFCMDHEDHPRVAVFLKIIVVLIEFVILSILTASGAFLLLLGVIPIKELSNETVWLKISTYVHLSFTAIFFISSMLHMISNTAFTIIYCAISKTFTFWILPKAVLCFGCLIGFPIMPITFSIAVSVFCPNLDINDLIGESTCKLLNFQRYFGGALLQYYFVAVICSFFLTYWYELRGTYLELFEHGNKAIGISSSRPEKKNSEKKSKKKNADEEKIEMGELRDEDEDEINEFKVENPETKEENVDEAISKQEDSN